MATTENLQEAFAGESQAHRKYLAFAKKAEQDGLAQVAKLFRAAAEAETVHAHAHLRVMGGKRCRAGAGAETVHAHAHFRVLGGVKSTAENVQAAIDGEGFEYKEMYPKFLAEAQSEGNKAAEVSIKNALAVEEIHYGLYSDALEKLNAGEDMAASAIVVCGICGNTILGDAPDKCPVCGAPQSKFEEVE